MAQPGRTVRFLCQFADPGPEDAFRRFSAFGVEVGENNRERFAE
jgi:hypothetical protein